MPLAWRKDLDFWMNQSAKDQGVVIRDRAKVILVDQSKGHCTVVLREKRELQKVKAGFVIGADGAASSVRKSLFPELKVRYSAPLRQCYRGSLDIEKDYIHWFFPRIRPRPRFDLNHKGDLFLLEGSGIRELGQDIETILGAYGYKPGTKPVWTDGCLMPLLHSELLTGFFAPAKENVLLIGDAAGLSFPITYEGIGAALKSGLLAADSITAASPARREAAEIYLHELTSFLKTLENLYSLQESLEQAPIRRASDLSHTLKKVYEKTLRVI
jgi:flavin-dependent dehydrogenase